MKDFLLIGVDIGTTFADAAAMSKTFIRTIKVTTDSDKPVKSVLKAIDQLILELQH